MNYMDAEKKNTARNRARRWIVQIALSLICCILVIVGIVYWADPFMYYRIPGSYKYYDARYCLAGILKNKAYDTVIVGSSMMQNTDPAILAKNGWAPIKATFSGACPADIKMLVNYSIKKGKPKRVIIAIDSFTFLHTPEYVNVEIPTYLYDDNVWNDGKYWFNNKVWFDIFTGAFKNSIGGTAITTLDLDTVDNWSANYKFGRSYVLESVKNADYDSPSGPSNLNQMKSTYDDTVYQAAFDHPEIEFYILYPPYSVLAWYGTVNRVNLEDDTCFKSYIMSKKLKNMRIFDFQDIEAITTNLDNYKDYSHYAPSINDYMINCLLTGDNEVKTPDEQAERNRRQIEIAESWSIDK